MPRKGIKLSKGDVKGQYKRFAIRRLETKQYYCVCCDKCLIKSKAFDNHKQTIRHIRNFIAY